MASIIERSPGHFRTSIPAQEARGNIAELDGSRRAFLKAMLTGIVILAIGVLLAWGVSDLWSNTMTDEEAANSLLVRDDLFGNLIGASDYNGLPAFVAPDAELTVPGGTLSGPVGMRTLVQEMNRVETGGSLLFSTWPRRETTPWPPGPSIDRDRRLLFGIEPASEVDGHVSGQMLIRPVDHQIVELNMTTLPN